MSANPSSPLPHAIRVRIGPDTDHGYDPAPHRYHLYLALSCPDSLGIAITHALLGLADRMPVTLLPPVPDTADGGYRALRDAYAATSHRHPGPAAAPALTDRWTGRVVSNHAPDIRHDLAVRFPGGGADLRPAGAAEAVDTVAGLCDRGVTAAAQRAGATDPGPERDAALARLFASLDLLEERLAHGRPYLLGDTPTAADIHLWVTLVHLDLVHRWHLDAAAVHRLADRAGLWAYARRLLAEPAFGGLLRPDDITRRHHHRCRGREAAGAAVQIVDWNTPVAALPAPSDRRPR
ncbi:glutathione S-transferase C-terminal domain-containing protein [Streptomyces sp. RFCAC02]|uniref:glutathione S-transferase C-terminal domain-containing protein n=1 Tax=Streptomyces sp. RFCAC02 TaxID=2499143 RepID=UPI00101EFEA6|nr:glutathione S-transferase C-terminal domain-containing protein [Streptomyces sp. RFCAC02]